MSMDKKPVYPVGTLCASPVDEESYPAGLQTLALPCFAPVLCRPIHKETAWAEGQSRAEPGRVGED